MLINRMSSFDLVYQFALIAVVELFYYCLNITCCFFLLYYELWYRLNVKVIVSNFNDTNREEEISVFLRCLDSYASLLKNNRRWRVLVENIAEADDILWKKRGWFQASSRKFTYAKFSEKLTFYLTCAYQEVKILVFRKEMWMVSSKNKFIVDNCEREINLTKKTSRWFPLY